MATQKLHYVLFKAAPHTQPPFNIELGLDGEKIEVAGCEHIPDAIVKLDAYCADNDIEIAENVTLLYPIYLKAMNTAHESTMLNIAWLIKDEADKKGWNYDRTEGYTGKTTASFLP